MIIETILGLVTGLLGPAITAFTNYKMQKLKNDNDQLERAHKVAMIKAESDAMIEEARVQIQIVQAKVTGAVELADAQSYQTSQEVGNQAALSSSFMTKMMNATGWVRILIYPVAAFVAALFGLVDFLKHLMRPALTAYLVGATTWITLLTWDIMQSHQAAITADQAVGIFTKVINVVVYLTVSCVTWWFADRRMAKFLMRLDDGNARPRSDPDTKDFVEYTR